MPLESHDEMMKKYLADPEVAAEYLNSCLEDGHPWLIGDALKLLSEIHGVKKSRTLLQQIEKITADFAPSKIRLRFEAAPKRRSPRKAGPTLKSRAAAKSRRKTSA